MFEILWILFTVLVSLAVHEFGHALAARACGFRVAAIRFGVGSPMSTWHWNRTEVSVAQPWTLFMGCVEVDDGNRGTIPQRLFVAAAGLLANVILVVVATLGEAHTAMQWDFYWAELGILNLGLIVLNLIPFVMARRRYSKLWSDGARIAGLVQERLTGRNFTERV
jgi:Zn-dependent protease